jgi:two-component system cell cycle sensor histidine kinase/response regulator CckA
MEQRKRIADQLSQVDDPRALLEGLFADAPIALQVFRADGHCLLSNQAFRDLFGGEPPPDYNIFRDDILDGLGMAPLIKRAFAGETIRVPSFWYDPKELQQVHVTEARRVAVESTFLPLFDREGIVRHVAICIKDVTAEQEFRAASQALVLREARYRTQFEAAPEAIVTLDVDSGRFIEVNQNAERLFGHRREELLEMNPLDISPSMQPDGRPSSEGIRFNVERAMVGEQPVFEWTHRNAAGRHIPCEIRLVRLPAIGQNLCRGSIVDISERKRLEAELRVSEASYREIFDNASDAIFVLDLQTFHILDANARASELTGYTKEELLSSDSAEQYVDEPGFTKKDGLAKLRLAAAGTVQVFEWKSRHKSGRTYFTEMSLRRAPIAGQERVLLFLRDINERKRLEQTLRQTEDQLRHSQKMEAIGRLAGGVAHDFNNLLSVVLGYSTLVLASLDPDDPRAADIGEIKIAGERAAKLTKQLLAFSRQQVLAPAVVDLNDIVSRMDQMLRRVIGEDIHLRTEMGDGLGRVKVDEGQIEQVIMNLAVNARDAMPAGGTLTISTANVVLDEEYARTRRGVSAGPHVRMMVSDTGAGMDLNVQSRIFEPFFTTKEKGKGTGLGLSTVLGIVEQSGGSVEVQSRPGSGTTFKVHLPITHDVLAPSRSTTPPRILVGSETLLLVEDEERLRALSSSILSDAGYRVIAATSALDALERCRHFAGPIHLLVTDVIMPDMNGRALAGHAARIRPEMKVLYVSGYADNSLFDLQGLSERVAFLQKPITPDILLRKVRETLDAER